MRHAARLAAVILAVHVAGAAPSAQRRQRPVPAPAAGELVELDVVVLDRDNRPVLGLRQEDFQIKEDGRAVDVKTFAAVATLGSVQPDDGRSVTLLMDDIGVSIAGTFPLRGIAQIMLSPAGQGDDLAVVRLSSRTDEAVGDILTARDRIGGYHGGVVPFSRLDTPQTVLKAVTKISRQLEAVDHRRKVILCLGVLSVCDVEEPALGGTSILWNDWVAAVGAAARANASLYCVDPTGLTQHAETRGVGLVRLTGGEVFNNTNDYVQIANAIWREASHYYLLGYWPLEGKDRNRQVHAINVSVARKDVQLRVRKRR